MHLSIPIAWPSRPEQYVNLKKSNMARHVVHKCYVSKLFTHIYLSMRFNQLTNDLIIILQRKVQGRFSVLSFIPMQYTLAMCTRYQRRAHKFCRMMSINVDMQCQQSLIYNTLSLKSAATPAPAERSSPTTCHCISVKEIHCQYVR